MFPDERLNICFHFLLSLITLSRLFSHRRLFSRGCLFPEMNFRCESHALSCSRADDADPHANGGHYGLSPTFPILPSPYHGGLTPQRRLGQNMVTAPAKLPGSSRGDRAELRSGPGEERAPLRQPQGRGSHGGGWHRDWDRPIFPQFQKWPS